MFKRISSFLKNLFNNGTTKSEVKKTSIDFNTKPQDKTWKDKQDKKLEDLEKRLEDTIVKNNDPSPTPQHKDPVSPFDFTQFNDLILLLEGRGFNQEDKGLYRLERKGFSIEVNLVDCNIYKVMGLTNISASFKPEESVGKVEKFLNKHLR